MSYVHDVSEKLDTRAFPGLPFDHHAVGLVCGACGVELLPCDVTMIHDPLPDGPEEQAKADAGRAFLAVGGALAHVDCERAAAQAADMVAGADRCILCGCTDNVACTPPCSWVAIHPRPICSSCATADWGMPLQEMVDARTPAPKPDTKFDLSIDLGNAAMQDAVDVADALHRVAEKLETSRHLEGRVMDLNGNSVGSWTLTLPDQEEGHDD